MKLRFVYLIFLLVLYLSLSTSPFRGRKNEYNAQRGRRPLAYRYHSQNHRKTKEKSEAKNEAVNREVISKYNTPRSS